MPFSPTIETLVQKTVASDQNTIARYPNLSWDTDTGEITVTYNEIAVKLPTQATPLSDLDTADAVALAMSKNIRDLAKARKDVPEQFEFRWSDNPELTALQARRKAITRLVNANRFLAVDGRLGSAHGVLANRATLEALSGATTQAGVYLLGQAEGKLYGMSPVVDDRMADGDVVLFRRNEAGPVLLHMPANELAYQVLVLDPASARKQTVRITLDMTPPPAKPDPAPAADPAPVQEPAPDATA
jgi:hypothetical protein